MTRLDLVQLDNSDDDNVEDSVTFDKLNENRKETPTTLVTELSQQPTKDAMAGLDIEDDHVDDDEDHEELPTTLATEAQEQPVIDQGWLGYWLDSRTPSYLVRHSFDVFTNDSLSQSNPLGCTRT